MYILFKRLILIALISINLLPNQLIASNNDEYAGELEWYSFNDNRASDSSLSDEQRWVSAQLAAQNLQNLTGNNDIITPHQIYDQGTRWAKDGVGGEYYKHTPIKYYPPLSNNSYNINNQIPYQSSYSSNINYSSQKPQGLNIGINANRSWNPYKSDPDFEKQLEIRKQYLATLQASGQQEVYCDIWTKQFEGYPDNLGKFYVGYYCIQCGHQQFHSQYYSEYKKPNEYKLPMMYCRGCKAKSGYPGFL